MPILKIIDIKIWECAHCSIHLRFMGLTGLISVHISLNVIVMYTWNNAGILPNQDLKGLLYLFKIYSECKVKR